MNRNGKEVRSSIDFYDEVRRFEIELILHALSICTGVQTKAATILQLRPTTLNSKIKQYEIDWRIVETKTIGGS